MNRSCMAALLLLSVSLVAVSCKSKKGLRPKQDEKPLAELAAPTSKAILIRNLESRENTFSYYSATGKAAYRDSDTDQELGVSIVMEKDRYIYMNVTALLGIPVARVLATPDSVVILDMLHRKCIIAGYSYIRKLANADLQFTQLQNMLAGNTLFPNNEQKMTVDTALSYILISNPVTPAYTQNTMYGKDLKVTRSTITERAKNREMKVEYADVYTQGSNKFPSVFNINIRAEKNIETKFELSNFVFEKKKELQFTIPKSYETVRM
jgi:hypothetical protein